MAVRTVDIGEEDHLAAITAAVDSMDPPEVFHQAQDLFRPLRHLRARFTHG